MSRKTLKENAIPTIFDFPENLKKAVVLRKPPIQRDLKLNPEVGTSSKENYFNNHTSDHSYFISESPRKLKRKYENIIDKKNEEIEKLKKRIKVCNLRVSRKAKKINNLVSIIEDLKEKNLVNCKTAELLEQNFSELSLQALKKKTKSFSNELKSFTLSLFFYSPKAYEYCRQTLMPSLPHPTTVRRWYNVINGCPGFTEEALSAVKERVDKTN
ncbi:THAP domain-containing protein 9, partial [Stegodyphus mimosarum]